MAGLTDESPLGPFERPRGPAFPSAAAWRGARAAGIVRPGDVLGRSVDLGPPGPDQPPWHVGILVGDDEVVSLGAAGVVRESVEAFARGRPLHLLRRPPRPRATVACARAAVGRRGYNLFSNNCAAFASRCLAARGPDR